MITFIPSECHSEFDKIKCEKIRIKKKSFFFFTTIMSYNGVSEIMIRKYDRQDPKIMAHVYLSDGRELTVSDILMIDVF